MVLQLVVLVIVVLYGIECTLYVYVCVIRRFIYCIDIIISTTLSTNSVKSRKVEFFWVRKTFIFCLSPQEAFQNLRILEYVLLCTHKPACFTIG